jgi:hypothetical protein
MRGIVIAGSGYMAEEYLKAISFLPNLKVVAIVSRNPISAKNLAEKYKVDYVAFDIRDAASATNADCLIVCVSELSTEEVIDSAIEYPWTILIEKPVGINYDQALRIVERCGDRNDVYVALNRRFYGATREVLNEISRTDGKRFIVLTDQEDQLAARKAGQPSLVVENWMYANSIHIIDYVTIFARGTLIELTKNRVELDDYAFVISADLKFDSGDYVRYLAYWNTPAKWSAEINIGDKQWQAKPLEKSRRLVLGEREFSDFAGFVTDSQAKPGLISMLMALEEQLSGRDSDLVPIKAGIQTMNIIEKIYEN